MRPRGRLDRSHADLARVPVPAVTPDPRRVVQTLVDVGVPEAVGWNSVVRPDGEPSPELPADPAAIANLASERRGRQPDPEESRQRSPGEP